MSRLSLILCSLLFAVVVKAEHSDLDKRELGQLLCRCEGPGESLYPRRLNQETEVENENRQLSAKLSNGFYMIDGIRVLPASDNACSSGSFRHRHLHQDHIHMTEEDKEELVAELEQMDENESILRPDKMRKLPYSNGYGYGYGYNYGYGYGSKGGKGGKGSKGSKGGKSVSRLQND
jgi:hypothetical protein